jgi:RNA polymerase sigma factor (TIGR02999 family)
MPQNAPEDSTPGVITKALQEWRGGDQEALSRLTTAVYRELRRVAAGILAGQGGQTVQPTVLVHELYFQLPGVQHIDWQSRAQFLNVAARMMRNILVDYARKQRAAKRGGGVANIAMEDVAGKSDPGLQVDVLLVNQLLDTFAVDYPRQAQVVELRFFGGLTEEETSEVLKATGLQSSARTVARDWIFAKAWLQNSIGAQSATE